MKENDFVQYERGKHELNTCRAGCDSFCDLVNKMMIV